MKKTVFLTEAFEKSLMPTPIEIDEELADVIITLNKKGYKTVYSCAGHYKNAVIKEKLAKSECTKEQFQNFREEHQIPCFSEDENYFYYEYETLGTSSYIMFDKNIKLPFYPLDFYYDEADNTVRYNLDYYGDYKNLNSEKKSKTMIEQELALLVKNLTEWANKLPVIENS